MCCLHMGMARKGGGGGGLMACQDGLDSGALFSHVSPTGVRACQDGLGTFFRVCLFDRGGGGGSKAIWAMPM